MVHETIHESYIHASFPGRNALTLHIEPKLSARRKYFQDKQSHAKARLVRAYVAADQRRITRAKISLIRILKELAESPELGSKRPFSWGDLEIVYRGGFDPLITWADCEETKSDWWKVAFMLERSLTYA